MKTILIIGLGRTGKHMAMRFMQLKNEVLAIDIKEELVNDIAPHVTAAQIGDCSREAYIASLGIRNFDICVCAIAENFQASLEITALLKDHNARFIVSLAHGEVHEKFLYRIGADRVLYPQREMALRVATQYSMDDILDYVNIGDDFSILEIRTPASWIGKTIVEANVRSVHNINVLCTRVDGKTTPIVSPQYVFNSSDHLMIMGSVRDVQKLMNDKKK